MFLTGNNQEKYGDWVVFRRKTLPVPLFSGVFGHPFIGKHPCERLLKSETASTHAAGLHVKFKPINKLGGTTP
jgi:hypothetical protein